MIYWDHNATTPCAPEVLTAMQPFWDKDFGNPASPHGLGRTARQALARAREQVAAAIQAEAQEVFFTAGATESNHLVFWGLLLAGLGERRRVAVSCIEHKSVLEAAALLGEHGFEVCPLPVNALGQLDLIAAAERIDEQTALVSVQVANNEVGTLQPVAALAEIAHRAGAFFHTDAAQALGKIPVEVSAWQCDFASFSAHKCYGPKGIGALYVAGGGVRWPWPQPLRGGGQEEGLRAGTHNVPAIVGFGEACRLLSQDLAAEGSRLLSLRQHLEHLLRSRFPSCIIHAQAAERLPGTLSLAFPGIPADVLIANAREYAVSQGAACSSGTIGYSHVLKQLQLEQAILETTIRISLGRDSQAKDFEPFAVLVEKLYARKEIL